MKGSFSLYVLFSALWITWMVTKQEFKLLDDVIKPQVDDRSYRLITLLSNKLDVLLISDPKTDKASAAIDVNVGHLVDEIPGLAHFCEHLLFMGTEKYPAENEYSSFLSAHGGNSNAYTGAENTNYYFEVNSEFLKDALDRFAQFFIAPLFNESGTDREMNAVDSEHKKNIEVDNWRFYQLDKDLSNPEHPYVKFGTGNIDTLKHIPLEQGIDIRKVLLDFHSKYYSANIMKLVILGKESLDELTSWAVEMFSTIKNKDTAIPTFSGHPISSKQCQTLVLVKPIKELRNLTLTFPMPDCNEYYKTQPGLYFSHLIGHESGGSILSLLKKKNWATGLSSSLNRGGMGFEFFKISVELTELGEENYEEIVVVIFQFIKMIRESGVQKWVFDEVSKISKTAFQFKEKMSPSSYTSHVASNMHNNPINEVLSRRYLISVYDASIIQKLMDLLTPENFRLMFASPAFETSAFQKAAYYGTEYMVSPFTDEFKAKLAAANVNPELYFPVRNTFIAEDFSVNKNPESTQEPAKILIENEKIRLWFMKDETFHVPKGHVYFQLTSPEAYESPMNCVLSNFVTDILKESLNEISYHAEVAGLEYTLENNTDGLLLHIGGYNDKLGELLMKIVEKLKHLDFSLEMFEMIRDRFRRSLKNWLMNSPHQHAIYYGSYITQEKLWHNSDKLRVLEDITYDTVKSFIPELMGHLHAEGLIYGNVENSTALSWSKSLVGTLNFKPLTDSQRSVSIKTHWIPEGHFVFSTAVHNPSNVNSAIEYILQIGDCADDSLRCQLSLLAQIASEPCFDTLRTKEQLGYMVFSGVRKQTGMLALRIIIQSERHPLYLESRIEFFLQKLRDIVHGMSVEEYTKHVNALKLKLLEKDKNLGQVGQKVWAHINSKYYDFNQHVRDANTVEGISQDQLLKFFDLYIKVESTSRRKLSLHLVSQKIGSESNEDSLVQEIREKNTFVDEDGLLVFKSSLNLSTGACSKLPLSEYFDQHLLNSTV